MRNFLDEGRVLPLALAANVKSGGMVIQGQIFGIAQTDGNTGDVVAVKTGGVYSLPKPNAASTAYTVGSNVYWDAANAQCTVSATANTRIGVATVAAANADVTVSVRLNGSF